MSYETTYYQKNIEIILNRAKEYYENNKETLRERERINRLIDLIVYNML